MTRRNPVSLSSTVQTGIPGVYMKSGVVLNDAMKGFLTELRKRLPFDIASTSGVRTALSQAQALAQDYRFDVYTQKDLVAELTASSTRPSVAEMTRVLQAQVDRGVFLSRHMVGDALDFRITGLSAVEIAQLKSVASDLGGKVLDEGDHVHVERIGGLWARFADNPLPYIAIAASVSVGVVVLALAWRYRRR